MENYNPYGFNPYQLVVIGLMYLMKLNFTCELYAEKSLNKLDKF